MNPRSSPNVPCNTATSGARQLVVHDAFEITWCRAGSYSPSFTPMHTVMSGSVAGALMMTFLAPAARCFPAFSPELKRPVDSMTTSTPRSDHGSAPGSRSASTRTDFPSTMRPSSLCSTVPPKRPWTESYFSRCASVAASVMSFTATISTPSARSRIARKTFRPILPNPLIPTRTLMNCPQAVADGRKSSRQPAIPIRRSPESGFRGWPADSGSDRWGLDPSRRGCSATHENTAPSVASGRNRGHPQKG